MKLTSSVVNSALSRCCLLLRFGLLSVLGICSLTLCMIFSWMIFFSLSSGLTLPYLATSSILETLGSCSGDVLRVHCVSSPGELSLESLVLCFWSILRSYSLCHLVHHEEEGVFSERMLWNPVLALALSRDPTSRSSPPGGICLLPYPQPPATQHLVTACCCSTSSLLTLWFQF